MNINRLYAFCRPVALAGLVFAAGAARASDLDFKLINNTNTDVSNLYLSPASNNDWGDPVPDGGTASGTSNDITFQNNAHGNACIYDFKAVFSDGTKAILYSVDLCIATKVALDVDDAGNITYTVTYLSSDK
jgi:hypothetical protein